MKRLRQNLKLNLLFILGATVVLLSCQQYTAVLHSQQALEGKAVTENSVAENTGEIAITVTNFVNQGNRTIAPDQLTGANFPADYTLRLTGTSSSGVVGFPDQELTLTNGKVTIKDVPESLWELTLTATSVRGGNGVGANAPILQAKAIAQVSSNGMTPVTFTLKPLETGNGSFQVTVNIGEGNRSNLYPNAIQKTLIGLYEKGTDNLVQGFTKDQYSSRYTQTSWPYPNGGAKTLAAGEYELRVEFTLFDELSAMWKEDVVIEPGRLTGGTVTVPHILKTPDQTSWAQDLISVTTPDNGLFETTLRWNTVGDTNATSYEIELKKLPDTSTRTENVITENDWNAEQGVVYTINGDPNSPNHFSKYMGTYPVALAEGTTKLDRTTNTLKLTLANGRYLYRIRSIGHSGQQGWTYSYTSGTTQKKPIICPYPATPTIPASPFNQLVWPYQNDNQKFQRTIEWNKVPYTEGYVLQVITFARKPTGGIEQFRNDNYWATARIDIQLTPGPNASGVRLGNYVYNWSIVRLRSKNAHGDSPWFYYPKYFTKDGAQS